MELSLISKYRTQLMGVAIIWTMFFHSQIYPDNSYFLWLKRMGYGGVDLFMFLSGFGIYYSLFVKKEPLRIFYKKRALRILPYYIPIVLFFAVFYYIQGMWSLKLCLYNITTVAFWLGYPFGKFFDWYIPSILLLYLLSPFFSKLFQLNKNIVTILTILFSYLLSFFLMYTEFSYLIIFTIRIPLYVAGFWFADFSRNHKDSKLSPVGIVLAVLFLAIGLFISRQILFDPDLLKLEFLVFFPFALVTFPFCIISAYLFSLLKNYKFPILTFFGTYTLVLFIFHERVMSIFKLYNLIYNDYLIFAITIVLAVSWQNLVDCILKKIN